MEDAYFVRRQVLNRTYHNRMLYLLVTQMHFRPLQTCFIMEFDGTDNIYHLKMIKSKAQERDTLRIHQGDYIVKRTSPKVHARLFCLTLKAK